METPRGRCRDGVRGTRVTTRVTKVLIRHFVFLSNTDVQHGSALGRRVEPCRDLLQTLLYYFVTSSVDSLITEYSARIPRVFHGYLDGLVLLSRFIGCRHSTLPSVVCRLQLSKHTTHTAEEKASQEEIVTGNLHCSLHHRQW